MLQALQFFAFIQKCNISELQFPHALPLSESFVSISSKIHVKEFIE